MVYSQRDYADVAYPSPALPRATVASGGCGVCCASMVLENLGAGALPPPAMAEFAMGCSARVVGGTDMGILGNALAAKYPVKWTLTASIDKVLAAVERKGAMAVANVGKAGLFSDSGHYVVVWGAEGGFVSVLDPYLYSGKFEKPGRKGKVTLSGKVARVSARDLDRDSKKYYIFEKTGDEEMEIKESTVKVLGASVPSLFMDGKNYVELRPMLDALNRGLALSATWDATAGAGVKAGE